MGFIKYKFLEDGPRTFGIQGRRRSRNPRSTTEKPQEELVPCYAGNLTRTIEVEIEINCISVSGVTLVPSPGCGATVATGQGLPPAVRTRVYVDGKAIAVSKVITKDGVAYVDTVTLAEALGASVQSEEGSLMVISATRPSCDSEKPSVDGQRISEQFCGDVARVADEIESLRAVVLKKEKAAIGPRFDDIDYELSLSTVHVCKQMRTWPCTTHCPMQTIRSLSSTTKNLAEFLRRNCKRISDKPDQQ